jgi:uncharacterized RDD family membrane protein YckC
MDDNRFQPPASDVTEPAPPVITDFELAKRDQRAAGLIIDALIAYPLMIVLKILPSALGIFALIDINIDLFRIPDLAAWLVTLFFYYLICEGIWHKTIGKLITGTHVIQITGETPTAIQILTRTLIRFIPLEFITYLDGNKRPSGWHDRWSGTRVTNVP